MDDGQDDDRFGPYRLLGLLGQGGMGEVHRAVDTRKDRVVALKRLPAELATDARFQSRFRREAQVAARLAEPHVIPIHDYGEIDGQLYLDMRFVEGVDLATLLDRDGPMPVPRVVRIVAQVACALDAAHGDGLVHRDVKPSNVLVTGADDDFAYLIDFGIARQSDTRLTTGSAFLGTAAYMAPERFTGSDAEGDHRVDIYSLGCVLYEILTGHRPFDGDGIAGLLYAHSHTAPPRPGDHDPRLAPFDAVVARAMDKDPARRHGRAGELAAEAVAAADVVGDLVAEPVRSPRRSAPSRHPTFAPPVVSGTAGSPAVDMVGTAVVVLFTCWVLGTRLWNLLDDGAAGAVPVIVACVLGPAIGWTRHRLVDPRDTLGAVFTGAVASLGALFPGLFDTGSDVLVAAVPIAVLLAGVGYAAAVGRWSPDPAYGRRAARASTFLTCACLAVVATLLAVATAWDVPDDEWASSANLLRILSAAAAVLLVTAVGLRLPVPARRSLGATLAVAVAFVWFETMWDMAHRLRDYDTTAPVDAQAMTSILLGVGQFFLVVGYVVVLVVTFVRLLWSVRRRRSGASARPTVV